MVKPSMDLGQDEDFIFKHPYFFSDLTFKFEGLRPEIQKDLENVVKSMGGAVSNESKHVFTDNICLPLMDCNQNYYSISYLSDCMVAEDILEIEDYKLTNTRYPDLSESTAEKTIYCCENAKYTWKSESCFSYLTRTVCCKLCIQKRGLPYHEPIKTNNNGFIGQSNGKIIDSNVHEQNKISQEISINTLNEGIDDLQIQNPVQRSSSDSVHHNMTVVNEEDFIVQAIAEVNQEKVTDNDSDSSDIEILEEHTNIQKSSSLNQKPNNSKSAKQVKKRRMSSESSSKSENSRASMRLPSSKQRRSSPSPLRKRIRIGSSSVPRIVESSEESLCDEEMHENHDLEKLSCSKQDTVVPLKNIKPSISRWIKKSSLPKPAGSNDEPDNSASEKGNNQNLSVMSEERRNWWFYLLPPKNYLDHCREGSKQNYQRHEQTLIITYLVVKNLIHQCTSRKPYERMMNDGYLKYRTVESINNQFRKTILPNIENYGLPEKIEKRFRDARKIHQRRTILKNGK